MFEIYNHGPGSGPSFVDFDNDGLDDFSLATADTKSITFYRSSGDNFIEEDLIAGFKTFTKQVLWIDVDYDGDIFFAIVLKGRTILFLTNGRSLWQVVSKEWGLDEQVSNCDGALWTDLIWTAF